MNHFKAGFFKQVAGSEETKWLQQIHKPTPAKDALKTVRNDHLRGVFRPALKKGDYKARAK